jgi:hypothetical protein
LSIGWSPTYMHAMGPKMVALDLGLIFPFDIWLIAAIGSPIGEQKFPVRFLAQVIRKERAAFFAFAGFFWPENVQNSLIISLIPENSRDRGANPERGSALRSGNGTQQAGPWGIQSHQVRSP